MKERPTALDLFCGAGGGFGRLNTRGVRRHGD